MRDSTDTLRSAAVPDGTDAWSQRVGAFSVLPALIAQLGGHPDSLLASVQLAPDALDRADARVPYAALCRLLNLAASETGCAHLGLLAGRVWRTADLGIVGELARCAPTVREALSTVTVHQHQNSGGGLAFVIERSETVDLGYAIYHPGIAHADQMHDAVLAAMFGMLRELCGPGWLPSEVLVAHGRPVDVAPYRRLFKVQPTFNAEVCAIRFPSRWMARAVDSADPARYRETLNLLVECDSEPLVHRVFRALRVVMLHGRSSGDDVAKMLAMHRRTLNRRLRQAGTTFQQVLDQVRFDVARQLLADSQISLDDIAATLGYAGVSPFMRTFRRWAGTTPGRWRKMAASGRLVEIAAAGRTGAQAFVDSTRRSVRAA